MVFAIENLHYRGRTSAACRNLAARLPSIHLHSPEIGPPPSAQQKAPEPGLARTKNDSDIIHAAGRICSPVRACTGIRKAVRLVRNNNVAIVFVRQHVRSRAVRAHSEDIVRLRPWESCTSVGRTSDSTPNRTLRVTRATCAMGTPTMSAEIRPGRAICSCNRGDGRRVTCSRWPLRKR